MASLLGHEAGNGGYRQGKPARHRAGPRPYRALNNDGSEPSSHTESAAQFASEPAIKEKAPLCASEARFPASR